jgi:putative CocE/NonD family hydrolase
VGAQETLTFLDTRLGHVGDNGDSNGDSSSNGGGAELAGPPVRVFVTGADVWRDLTDWPPAVTEQTWYLHAGGRLSNEPPADSEPDLYHYDPADPTPSVGGPRLSRHPPVVDNRRLEARPDVLTYTSAPLDADLEIAGSVEATIEASSDRETFDVFVRLCDVRPDGASINICDRLVRLSADLGAPAGTVRTARLELWPTAHRFLPGHRIRIQVSSGAHPRYVRNLGTAEPLATATTLAAATQRVHHDPAHPSAIRLPVIDQ